MPDTDDMFSQLSYMLITKPVIDLYAFRPLAVDARFADLPLCDLFSGAPKTQVEESRLDIEQKTMYQCITMPANSPTLLYFSSLSQYNGIT